MARDREFAYSRAPHVHLRSQGSRPSLSRVLNEKFYKKFEIKSYGARKVELTDQAQFKLRPSPPVLRGCAHLALY